MRVKKTPLLLSILCSFTFFLRAADQQQVSAPMLVSSDTAIVNDSLQTNIAPNDPRKAFKDLFIGSTNKTESYSVQLNPRAISFVQDYMGHHTKRLEQMKGWGKPYFDMMDGILVSQGLPGELKYLAVVESNLKSSAFSWAALLDPAIYAWHSEKDGLENESIQG
jgi:membrane-bound lytic murein transglycosylase D